MVRLVASGLVCKFSKLTFIWKLALFALLSVSLCVSGEALDKKPIHRPHHDPGTAQEAAGGFWRTDRDFDASLRIKNILLKQPLEVTPVLYMADGTEIDLAPIKLPAAGVASVNIGRMLQGRSLGAHLSSYGTAAVRYKWSWAAVLGTIQNTDEMESITFHSTLNTNITQLNEPTAVSSTHVLRGMWWAPHTAPAGFVALSDVAAQPISVLLGFTNSAGQSIANKSVTVSPHATTLIALQDTLSSVTDVNATGAITITYTGTAGSIVASAGIEDRAVGYSATPKVSEVTPSEDPSGPVELVAPGVMVGPSDPAMLFPASTVFTPYTYLQNLSSQPLQVSILAANNGSPRVSLGAVSLPTGGTTKVDIPGMITKAGVPLGPESTNLLFSYTGRQGDLGVEAGSTDQTNNYVFEVSINSESPTISRTICYWTIGGDNDTMIDLWNYTNQASDQILTILFTGGQYKVPVHLVAGAGTSFSIHKLQKLQVPDVDGHTLPINITEGSALLAAADGETKAMSIAVSAASFNVRNGTCGVVCTTCNGVTEFTLTPDYFAVSVGGNAQMVGQETYNTGTTQNTTSGTWSSSSQSIATASSAGVISGVARGQSNIQLLVDGIPVDAGTVCSGFNPQCPPAASMGAESPANVGPIPNSMIVSQDLGNVQNNSCSVASQNGLVRQIYYQTLNGSNPAGSWPLQEGVTPPTSSCDHRTVYTSSVCSAASNAQGIFGPDTLRTGYCSATPNNSCGFSLSPDHWQVCANGIHTIGSPTYVVHWNSITINGSTFLPGGTPIP